MHRHIKEGPIQSKKILIPALILTALFVSGYSYFQSSAKKHRQFLLNQALFPDFTSAAHQLGLPVKIERTVLGDDRFTLVLKTPELNPDKRTEIANNASEIVENWQKTQTEFKDLESDVLLETETPSQEEK